MVVLKIIKYIITSITLILILELLVWYTSDNVFQDLHNCHYLYTVKPVHKGHSKEPENVPFMGSCPLYTG